MAKAAAGAHEPAKSAGRHLRAVNDCDEVMLPGEVNHSLQAEAVKQHGSVHWYMWTAANLTDMQTAPHDTADTLTRLEAHCSEASDAQVVHSRLPTTRSGISSRGLEMLST